MGRVREIGRLRRRVWVGAPERSLTPVSGTVAVTELVDRLDMIGLLDATVGPIEVRDRGFTGGQLLVGMAAAQLVGEDFLVGLDRQRADAAGQVLAPVPGLGSTAAAGLARRFTGGQWHGVETGIGDIHTADQPQCCPGADDVAAATRCTARSPRGTSRTPNSAKFALRTILRQSAQDHYLPGVRHRRQHRDRGNLLLAEIRHTTPRGR